MRSLEVNLGSRSYPIQIGTGLLATAGRQAVIQGRTLRVLTDATVAQHHLPSVLGTFKLLPAHALVLPAGETQKNMAAVERVLDWMLEQGLGRDSVLVALGGGVVGDLAGFCAAIYQRGIDFIQIPTTLLAQVDSSVGGKTGVNHARGKNMIGAFHQPRLVLADLDTLKTLPARELRAGLAEVIKYGLLGDARFFAWLEQHLDALLKLDPSKLAEAVEKCCAMKARIVGEDERESLGGGTRALLNLGHTFAHAIETHTGYGEWLHGEAVAVGLCMAADLSVRLGWLSRADAERAQKLIQRAGLPVATPTGLTPARFLELMGHDKKVQAGQLRLVLLKALGHAVLTAEFDNMRLNETLAHFCK
ncbi:MAG: 3-dehydroquinate synthase [Pseudomonadota bacterium]